MSLSHRLTRRVAMVGAGAALTAAAAPAGRAKSPDELVARFPDPARLSDEGLDRQISAAMEYVADAALERFQRPTLKGKPRRRGGAPWEPIR